MTNDAQAATDTNSDAEPAATETSTAIVETPPQAPRTKRAGRGTRLTKATKAPKPAKSARARKAGNTEEAVAPISEKAAETVVKSARTRRLAGSAKLAKPTERGQSVKAAKIASPTKKGKRATPEKAAEVANTATAKPAKVARSTRKALKTASATAPARSATVAAGGRGKGARYTTNELNSAVKKAGLTVEFTPVVTKPANISRGPAKDFKVDAIVAHVRGSNGDLIRGRGPGTPLYNDAESLAAVGIFDKFRGKTFHNKLKVEIL